MHLHRPVSGVRRSTMRAAGPNRRPAVLPAQGVDLRLVHLHAQPSQAEATQAPSKRADSI
eukprot:COSAG02_NODE_56436_length_285_cov_1.263441_2_plen_59_part_01